MISGVRVGNIRSCATGSTVSKNISSAVRLVRIIFKSCEYAGSMIPGWISTPREAMLERPKTMATVRAPSSTDKPMELTEVLCAWRTIGLIRLTS